MVANTPYVLLDVDGVVVDYTGQPMPGIVRLVDTLRLLGFLVALWSAGGHDYCRQRAEEVGLGWVATFDKPPYPPDEREALALVGYPPALQVDDDPTERVGDWPFMLVEDASTIAGYVLTRKGGSQDPGAKGA